MRKVLRCLAGALLGCAGAFLVVRAVLPGGEGGPRSLERAPAATPVAPVAAPPELAPVAAEPAPPSPGRAVDTAGVTGPEAAPPPSPEAARGGEATGTLLVCGVVSDAAGAPLAQATVQVELPGGERLSAGTDRRGRYVLGPLARRTWSVTAWAHDHRSCSAEVTPPDGAIQVRCDLTLAAERLVRVRIVTRAGEPAVPALVAAGHSLHMLQLVPVATDTDPGEAFLEVTGSLNNGFGIGNFRQLGWSGRPQETPADYGVVAIGRSGPAWLSLVAAHQVVGKERIDDGTREVTFVLDPEDLLALRTIVRGVVRDGRDGRPLAARIDLSTDPFVLGRPSGIESSADDGGFAVEGTLPGRRWLLVAADGRAMHRRRLDVPRGGTFDVGEVLLWPPVELAGRVEDDQGRPCVKALEWGTYDPATRKVAWVQQFSASSAPDGTFRIPGLEPGLWAVRAPAARDRAGDRVASLASVVLLADAQAGSATDLVLRLVPTTEVTFATGAWTKPAEGGPWPRAGIVDAADLPLATAWLGRYGDEASVRVPPGDWTLLVKRAEEVLLTRPLRVEGERQRVEVEP